MILHTVVGIDALFPTQLSEPQTLCINGSFVEVDCGDGRCVIRRLVSTDPKMYLKDSFQIGKDIKIPPV